MFILGIQGLAMVVDLHFCQMEGPCGWGAAYAMVVVNKQSSTRAKRPIPIIHVCDPITLFPSGSTGSNQYVLSFNYNVHGEE